MPPRRATFIYLIGLAGTGKLTIAREIQRRFDCLLFDNHLVNNVVFSLIDPDGMSPIPAAVWERVAAIRQIALDTLRRHARAGRSFVFTNELLEGEPRHAAYFAQVQSLAQARDAVLVPVRLLIDGGELSRRVSSPGRAAAYKDIDATGARLRAQRCTLLRPAGIDCLDLDVTALSAGEAAQRIVEHAASRA